MTFYNPNIQAKFEEDERSFVQLTGQTFARYVIVYTMEEGTEGVDPFDPDSTCWLSFLRYESAHQQRNLTAVHSFFGILLADIALEVLTGRVSTFWDYILQTMAKKTPATQYEALYMGDKIQDFIELLVYSDIASKHESAGERDFNRIFCVKKEADEPLFYTLYERLKLYDFLKREMRLSIDRKQSKVCGNEVHLCLKMAVEAGVGQNL